MSHVAKIEMKVKNLNALKRACANMGLEFREGQKTYAWYGTHVGDYPIPEGFTKADMGKCDHAIHVPGAAYEVGVVESKTKPGEHELLWDFWGSGGLENKLGKGGGLLKQAYAVEQTKMTAMNQGHMVTEQKQKDGTIRLVVTVH